MKGKKKNMKTKILIFILSFTIAFSFLVVPSFAFEVGEDYTFVENPSYTTHFENFFDFYCDGTYYAGIKVALQPGTSGQFYEMHYYDVLVDGYTLVYVGSTSEASGTWIDESYRTFTILYDPYDENGIAFMELNELLPSRPSGWYYDIYNMLRGAVFSNAEIDGYQSMSLSIVSLVLCLIAFAIPILVVLFLIKYVLSMRF